MMAFLLAHPPFARRAARLGRALAVAGAVGAAPLALAASSQESIVLESDRPCTADYGKRITSCSGNVVVTQGPMQLRAERLEVRETADGQFTLQAQGSAAAPARARQTRAGQETLEGSAQRIDYDGRTRILKMVGTARVQRARAGAVADELQGATITWNGAAETIQVEGGQATSSNPGGRVRAVITPRAAAPEPADAAGRSTLILKPAATVGERP